MWNLDWKLIRNFIRTSLKKRWFLRIGQLIKSTPQFNTDNLSSTHRFHTWTTRFQRPKPPQFLLSLSLSSFLSEGCVELRGFKCGTDGCVELRGFRCWTEGFWGLKRSGPFVWNWCVELRGTPCKIKIRSSLDILLLLQPELSNFSLQLRVRISWVFPILILISRAQARVYQIFINRWKPKP